LVTDTAIISHLADTVLYVARANYTEKKLLKYIGSIKKNQSIKSMGVILNNVGENERYGYNYKYSYNYGYGYGYGATSESKPKKSKSLSKLKKWFKIK
jgi:Mrp family chromosome partitioning ATPase